MDVIFFSRFVMVACHYYLWWRRWWFEILWWTIDAHKVRITFIIKLPSKHCEDNLCNFIDMICMVRDQWQQMHVFLVVHGWSLCNAPLYLLLMLSGIYVISYLFFCFCTMKLFLVHLVVLDNSWLLICFQKVRVW